jgi:uncharacterized membrane protein YgdD (TMEM256/DUF423 family)
MSRRFLLLGAINGFLTVLLGAFGAHDLRSRIPDDLYSAFQTGVHYQGVHSLLLLIIGLLGLHHASSWLHRSGWLIQAGILLFSGSLYLLALTGTRTLGILTPAGGIVLLAGWLCLILAARRVPTS